MVRTDIFRRGVPWTILIKRTGTIETDLNVKADQKACVVLTGVDAARRALRASSTPWAGIVALPVWPRSSSSIARFFGFLVRRKGLAFACAALPLHLIYYCCCGLSVVIAQYYWYTTSRDRGLGRPTAAGTRTDRGTASIPRPAVARWARRLSRWRARIEIAVA